MQKEHENERRSASAESALRYMQSFMRSFRIAPECSQVQMATLIITYHLVYTKNGEPLSTWGLTNIEGSLHDSICVLALSEVWGKHPGGGLRVQRSGNACSPRRAALHSMHVWATHTGTYPNLFRLRQNTQERKLRMWDCAEWSGSGTCSAPLWRCHATATSCSLTKWH